MCDDGNSAVAGNVDEEHRAGRIRCVLAKYCGQFRPTVEKPAGIRIKAPPKRGTTEPTSLPPAADVALETGVRRQYPLTRWLRPPLRRPYAPRALGRRAHGPRRRPLQYPRALAEWAS